MVIRVGVVLVLVLVHMGWGVRIRDSRRVGVMMGKIRMDRMGGEVMPVGRINGAMDIAAKRRLITLWPSYYDPRSNRTQSSLMDLYNEMMISMLNFFFDLFLVVCHLPPSLIRLIEVLYI
jgi:hypothetical protein